ncbi:MAG: UDP-N-acetylglucosamine 2-epimerase (non-hydrolyzing) [Clostridia bacterium]|nr:UDP-N-acetylglucosamine 2-epimerase (non-hydrolyzing) [Clostridia bacterium]
MKKKILVVIGTRPEAIKMAPVLEELRRRENFICRMCMTGQHRELLYETLSGGIPTPDYTLEVMRQGQSLSSLTQRILEGVDGVVADERPDLVLVQGDTTTAFASALVAFYRGIPVGHVEAGLRTYDMSAPFPEEWNRQGIGLLTTYHFAPTQRAREYLLREGKPADRVAVTGNTVIDALLRRVREDYTHPLLDWAAGSRLLLLTAHRRENRGEPMEQMFRGIRRVVDEFPKVKVVFPVHPHPGIGELAEQMLGNRDRIRLVPPMPVTEFQNIMARCYLILTDSGGIQEEAPTLHKPVLVLRNTTERREGLEAGVTRLIGTAEGAVYRGIRELLENDALYSAMSQGENPYGDGHASRRIADFLERQWVYKE